MAECVSLFLLNKVISLRTDLLGNIRAHYRFSEKGQPCSGLLQMGELGQQDLMLVPVPNTTVVVSFEVDTGSDLLQFRAPVGQAVPVAAIVDHLICWLGLSAGRWELSIGGDVLDHSNILFDVADLLESRTLICRQRSK